MANYDSETETNIRDWNSLSDSPISSAEGAEDSVTKFTSLMRPRD